MSDIDKEIAQQKLMQKEVAFYQTFLSAWVSSRMEKDKQVLTLSGFAIGLLVTFQSILLDVVSICIWLVSGGAFILSIILILRVFSQNSDYIEQVICDDDQKEKRRIEKRLQKNTQKAFRSFIVGAVLTLFLVGYISGLKIIKGSKIMSNEDKTNVEIKNGLEKAEALRSNEILVKEGLDGADKLKPLDSVQSDPSGTSDNAVDNISSSDDS